MVVCTSAVHAQAAQPNFELSAGAHLLVSPTTSCRQSGDVVGCTGPRLGAGFDVAAQLRVVPWLALGLHGAGSSMAVNSIDVVDESEWFWRVALQARFEPPVWPKGLWLALEVGAAFMAESFAPLLGSVTPIHENATQAAPLIAAGVGWDWIIARLFLIGLDVRALWTPFSSRELRVSPEIVAEELGNLIWIATGVRIGVVF